MTDFERITSKDNEIIRLAAALVGSAKRRREENLFILDGLRLCRDAVQNGFEVECFIVGDTAYDKFREDAESLCNSSKRACLVPDNLIEKISDTVSPQGFICICKMRDNEVISLKEDGLYIALENVQDPSNLGAISRTAEAFNFDGIVISANGCDPFSPKSLRASMGALLRLPVILSNDLIDLLENTTLDTYAAVVRNGENLGDIPFDKGSVMVVGNEANGLSERAVSACKKAVTIPMTGRAESLNVGAASSILMWEMSKAL